MVNIHTVNRSSIVNALVTAAILLAIVSLAAAGSLFVLFVLAAAAGALIGLIVAHARRARGLGATEIGERAPEHAGNVGLINMAHIPVMGIGGAGIVAMAFVVALVLPEGRTQLAWGLSGAILGASGIIAWRHAHGTSPFAEHPEETLHLR